MKADSILKEDLGFNKIKKPFHVSFWSLPVTPGISTSTLCIHISVERAVEWGFRAQALGSEFGLKLSFAAQEVCVLGQVLCTPYSSVSSYAE